MSAEPSQTPCVLGDLPPRTGHCPPGGPRLFAVQGIYAAQPAADVLTMLVCLFSIKPMQDIASRNLHR